MNISNYVTKLSGLLLLIVIVSWSIPITTFAADRAEFTVEDSVKITLENDKLPESFDQALDSLLHSKYKNYYSLGKSSQTTPSFTYSDEHYRQKLMKLNSAIPIPYNPIIKECIDLYVNSRSKLLSAMLAKSAYYFPIIEEQLDRFGLPLELKYLAIVESALNPIAVSRQGATGLWQFMLPTGKLYGLRIDSLIDERCDPVRSTQAACAYFKDLYEIYGDWLLVIAAYNCGPGNINKAIRKTGGNKDFWRIYQHLPRETRSYVPFFIAAYYSMEYYDFYRVKPDPIMIPIVTDTVLLDTKHSFAELSRMTDVSEDTIRLLNPKFRRGIVPGHSEPHFVVLPANKAISFAEVKDSLIASRTPVDIVETTITHKVRKGETLSKIARMYGVDVADLKVWNKLRRSSARVGQTLVVKTMSEVPDDIDAGVQQAQEKKPEKASVRYHTVKRGETLSIIALKYKGVTVAKLRRANNLKSNKIKPGQKLIVPQA